MTQWGLDNLFNPGKRHMDDEKRRLQSTREEIGDSSGGRRIDLEAGKVSISVKRAAAAAEATADGELEPALEVTEVPAVALANDDAEIVPELVDDTADTVVEAVVVDVVVAEPAVVEPPAVEDVDQDPTDEPVEDLPAAAVVDDDAPIEAPQPVAAAPRRTMSSALAWSRRG